jgi:hypothetical protein
MLSTNFLKIHYPTKRPKPYIWDRVDRLITLIQPRFKIVKVQSDLSASIIFEKANGEFAAIDFGDRDNPAKFDTKELIKDNKCKFVLKCQLRPDNDNPKLKPFFYWDKMGKDFNIDHYRSLPKIHNKLYFRGNIHCGRHDTLSEMNDLLNPNWDIKVGHQQFFKELSQHKIALSLRGMAKTNHRELESFAVGTPVIMEENPNLHHVPLVPDYHYISVTHDGKLSDCIRERLSQVDDELLEFVRRNAMNYYDDNIKFEKSVRWMMKLLELEPRPIHQDSQK